MGKAGPGSLRLTDPARPCAQVIRDPQPRSSRWLSTSIPKTQWQESLARTFSAEYNVNNLVSPVLFQEALWHVPENAVVLEIAPHALLQVRVVPEGWWAGRAPWDRAGGQWQLVRGRPSLSASAGRPEERPQDQLHHHPTDEEGPQGQPGVLPQQHRPALPDRVRPCSTPGGSSPARPQAGLEIVPRKRTSGCWGHLYTLAMPPTPVSAVSRVLGEMG